MRNDADWSRRAFYFPHSAIPHFTNNLYRLDKSDLVKTANNKSAAFGASSHSGGSKVYASCLRVLSLWTLPVESYWPTEMSKESINTKYFC